MTDHRWTVSPEVIDWILENADNPQESTIQKIEQWKHKAPTIKQIEAISKKTHLPLGYFFMKTPPEEDLSFLDFRTIKSTEVTKASRNLIDTINDMERVRDWMREYRIHEDYAPLDFIGSVRVTDAPMDAATIIRQGLDLCADWFTASKTPEESFNLIRGRAGRAGIIVMMNGVVRNNTHRKLDIEEFRAFALIDDYAPLIFINSADSPNGRLFSLLHEIVHIWLGSSNLYNVPPQTTHAISKKETFCNAVAAELIVPSDMFKTFWENETTDTPARVKTLSKKFRCSQVVIARRALDIGFIDSTAYQDIVDKAVDEFRKRGAGGGNYYRTAKSKIDYWLMAAVADDVWNGRTQYTEAFRLTNTTYSTFSTLVQDLEAGKW